jgi:hypothetical protein
VIGKSTPRLLPKMGVRQVAVAEGAVCAQMVRCGKANCRCARGELHGPYFYRFTRDGGRLQKQYIKRSEVAEWRELCERRREYLAERAMMRELARRAIGPKGRVNLALAELVLSLPWKTEVVTPEGEGLSRGLITKARDFGVLIDLSHALRGKPVRRALRRG